MILVESSRRRNDGILGIYFHLTFRDLPSIKVDGSVRSGCGQRRRTSVNPIKMSAKSAVDYSVPGMLHQILSSEDYALALTPGFYRFYAHIGVLQALEERGCLRPSHVSGSSAGALVGGFLASGEPLTCVLRHNFAG
jgi:hypothetical protein